MDRAHRIGQKKVVHIHRLKMTRTIDDSVITLQDKKRSMVSDIYDYTATLPLKEGKHSNLDHVFRDMGKREGRYEIHDNWHSRQFDYDGSD